MVPGAVLTSAVMEVASACLSDLTYAITTVTLTPRQENCPKVLAASVMTVLRILLWPQQVTVTVDEKLTGRQRPTPLSQQGHGMR
jgi:hypothetical protein